MVGSGYNGSSAVCQDLLRHRPGGGTVAIDRRRDGRFVQEALNPSAQGRLPSFRRCQSVPAPSRRCRASHRSAPGVGRAASTGRCRSVREPSRSCRSRWRMRSAPGDAAAAPAGVARRIRAGSAVVAAVARRCRQRNRRRGRCSRRGVAGPEEPPAECEPPETESRSAAEPSWPRSPPTGFGRSINPPTSAAPTASAMAAAIEPPLIAAEAASPPPAIAGRSRRRWPHCRPRLRPGP